MKLDFSKLGLLYGWCLAITESQSCPTYSDWQPGTVSMNKDIICTVIELENIIFFQTEALLYTYTSPKKDFHFLQHRVYVIFISTKIIILLLTQKLVLGLDLLTQFSFDDS